MAVDAHCQFDYIGQGQSSITHIWNEEFWFSNGEPYPDIAKIEKILLSPHIEIEPAGFGSTTCAFCQTGLTQNARLWMGTKWIID
jgi:hypothetical protein